MPNLICLCVFWWFYENFPLNRCSVRRQSWRQQSLSSSLVSRVYLEMILRPYFEHVRLSVWTSCSSLKPLAHKYAFSKHWRLSTISKTTKKVYEKIFLICKSMYVRELQLITVILLISDSYMSWCTRFVSLKLCVWGIFHFQFRFAFIKVYIFLQQNA